MTNQERVLALIGFTPSNANAIPGELTDVGLTPTDVYNTANMNPVKIAAVRVMELLLTTADTRNEGGYAITYDRAAVQKRIDQLKKEAGLTDETQPYIKSRDVW